LDYREKSPLKSSSDVTTAMNSTDTPVDTENDKCHENKKTVYKSDSLEQAHMDPPVEGMMTLLQGRTRRRNY
jgi:hypothetical protein